MIHNKPPKFSKKGYLLQDDLRFFISWHEEFNDAKHKLKNKYQYNIPYWTDVVVQSKYSFTITCLIQKYKNTYY